MKIKAPIRDTSHQLKICDDGSFKIMDPHITLRLFLIIALTSAVLIGVWNADDKAL